jgi:subtilisin family serine protease
MAGTRILRALSVACVMIMVLTSFSMLVLAKKDDDQKVRVIVLFKEKVDKKLVEDSGGEILDTYDIIPGVVTELTADEIKALRKSSNIRSIEEDGHAEIVGADNEAKPGGSGGGTPPAEVLPWGVNRIDADLAWTKSTGAGIKVAVLDTGIDKTHPDLKDHVKGGVNFVPSRGIVDSTAWNDDNGHGSHCAGIIGAIDNTIGVIGVAPNVDIYSVKVLNKQGSGDWSWIIGGINWAVTNHMQVISMSLGGGGSTALKTACDSARAAGILIIAAAGNDGGAVIYPAAYESVIAVGATNNADARASWSCYGPELDLVAPGVSIYSTYKSGGYATMSGTSMACPHVAGTVALVLQSHLGWTPSQVQTYLQTTADDLGATGFDPYYGYGLVDAQEAATGVQS